VLLSQLEETLVIGDIRYPLSTNLYHGDVVHPSGYLHMVDFRLDPNPTFTYGDGQWMLTKKIWMVHGQNSSVIEYTLSDTGLRGDACLEVRPLIAFRDYHGTTHETEVLDRRVDQADGVISVQPYPSLPRLYIAHDRLRSSRMDTGIGALITSRSEGAASITQRTCSAR
jgi:predicted glycogen debranching enzyme